MGDRDWHDLNESKVSDRTSIMRNEGDGGIAVTPIAIAYVAGMGRISLQRVDDWLQAHLFHPGDVRQRTPKSRHVLATTSKYGGNTPAYLMVI